MRRGGLVKARVLPSSASSTHTGAPRTGCQRAGCCRRRGCWNLARRRATPRRRDQPPPIPGTGRARRGCDRAETAECGRSSVRLQGWPYPLAATAGPGPLGNGPDAALEWDRELLQCKRQEDLHLSGSLADFLCRFSDRWGCLVPIWCQFLELQEGLQGLGEGASRPVGPGFGTVSRGRPVFANRRLGFKQSGPSFRIRGAAV